MLGASELLLWLQQTSLQAKHNMFDKMPKDFYLRVKVCCHVIVHLSAQSHTVRARWLHGAELQM